MKQIPLTQGKIALVDDEDYETVNQYKWFAMAVRRKNVVRYWYAATKFGRKNVSMHRLLMGIDGPLVDHKNHDTLDNRRSNLRHATRAQNNQNQRLSTRNKSGYKGVIWHKNRWEVYLRLNGQSRFVGSSTNKEEAAEIYNHHALLHYGEFALLNNIGFTSLATKRGNTTIRA